MLENLKCLMFRSITHLHILYKYFEKHPKFQAGRSIVQVFFLIFMIPSILSLQVVTKQALSYPKCNNEFTTCNSVSLPH